VVTDTVGHARAFSGVALSFNANGVESFSPGVVPMESGLHWVKVTLRHQLLRKLIFQQIDVKQFVEK
jgi:hypothetical protein